MKKLLLLVVSLFLACVTNPAPAQAQTRAETGRPLITNYRASDIGTDPQCWSFAQDSRGVIYIGSAPGVMEYDGASWRMIPVANKSFARSLAIDGHGRIYVGASADFGYLAPDPAGELHYVSLLPQVSEAQRRFNYVWTTIVTPQGIYFQTRERLFRFAPQEQESGEQKWQIKIWEPQGALGYAFWRNGTYYVQQNGVGLMKMVDDSLHLLPGGEQFRDDRLQVMLPYDNDGETRGTDKYLVGTFNRGLFLFDGKSFQPFKTEIDDFLRNMTLYDATVLPDGAYGLATLAGGFVMMNRQGKALQYLDTNVGALGNTITAVFADRQGTVWLAPEGGITVMETPSPLSLFDAASGLVGGVYYILRHRGTLYVGGANGIFYLDPASGTFKSVSGLEAGNPQAFHLLAVGDELLAGVSGLYRIEGSRATLIIKNVALSFSPQWLHRSQLDSNRIFAGLTDGLAVIHRDPRKSGDWEFETRIPGISSYISYIIEPRPGELWLGTGNSGVFRLRYDVASLASPQIDHFDSQQGLSNDGGVSIFMAAGRPVFVTTDDVFRFDESRQRFEPDSLLQVVGFGNASSASGVREDHQGNIWVNFGREIALLTRQPDGAYRTEKTPFLRFADVAVTQIYPEENGTVWFGSTERLLRYDPGIEKNYAAEYSALIRRITVGEDSLIYGGFVGAAGPVAPTLPYAHNALRFEFAATSYDNPRATQYQSKLEGFDDHWSNWSKENKRDYTNLPSGEYRFRVKAKNIYQHESSEAVYEFKILPPWYRSAWAYLLYLLAAGGFVFGLIRIRTRQLKARQRELEKTVEERTQEIQQKVNELAIINSVGSGLAKQLDFQAIVNLVGDKIRDIFKSPTIYIALHDRKTNLVHFPYYLELEQRIKQDSYPLGTGLTSHVIKSCQPLLIVENAEQRFAELGAVYVSEDEVQKKSWLGVPILMGEVATGVITLQDVKEHAYTEADVRLLSTLAANMGVALENARLFDETNRLLKDTEQRNAELAVINSVQEGLVAQMDMQGIYDLVGEKMREIFNAQVIDIVTYDREANLIEDRYSFEKGDRTRLGPRPPKGFRKHVIENRQPLVINQNAEQAGHEYGNPVLIGEAPKALVFVPMIAGGEVTGVVSLQNVDQENAFPDSDVRLLTTLANSMSVALENARLFDETNRLLKETEARAAELAIINKVGEGLAQQLDFQGIIDLVGDKIVEVFKAQVVSVSLYDPKANTIHHRYVLERGERFYFDQAQACDVDRLEIVQTRKPLVFGTSEEMVARTGEEVIAGEFPKSYMGVPIILGQEATGVVTVQDLDREHAFAESDVRLLVTLASNMGVALENARLFDETNRLLKDTEQRNAELAIINSVGEAMAKQLDVQTVTRIVGDKVREIFKAEATEILLLDANTSLIHVPYSYYRGYQTVEAFPLGEGLTSIILKSRKPLVHGTLQEGRELGVIILSDEEATESYMGVPIIVGERVLGVVSVQSYKQHAYDENSVRLLSTLSSNMGVAIENARLFDETHRLLKATEQRNAELAVINTVQEGLVRELDMQGIYDLVGNRLTTLFDIQVVIIRTFDHDTGMEHWQFAFEKGERLQSAPRPFNWANRQLIRTRQPILINENYVKTAQKFGGKGVTVGEPPKSAVFMPLLVGDTVKGSISLQNVDRENAFSESDVRLLSTLANSMSVALENARLFHETNRLLADTKQRAAELATVNSISEALASQLKQDDLIQLVGEQIRQVFRANIVYVALLDKATNMIHFPYSFGEDAAPLAFGEGLTSQIIKTGKPLLINEDVDESYTKLGIADTGAPAESYLGVPIPVGAEVIGVISAQSSEQENRFTEDDLRLLNTIAANVGVALHNARLFEETQEARAAAEEANEAKSSFLSTVSHELRTPLTSVLGFAKIIKKRLEEKVFPLLKTDDNKVKRTVDQVAENLNVVVAEGERLTTLINNVLDLAKIEAGKIEWHMEKLSIPDIIERATAATSSLFDSSGLKLKKEVDASLPDIVGDQDKMIQVVINLISNAVKFTDKGSVTCRAKQKDGEIVVSIIDTGMGIAPEDQPRVFEKFKQVGDTLTNKPKGTGLGLTICREIVEHHGGRIWVESEIGVGSTFAFALPLKDKTERESELAHVDFAALMAQLKQRVQTTAMKSKNGKPSILVVDDEASIRELLNQNLHEAGYQVRVASNGREALEQVRREPPDLIILDVMMPEMNGFDVAAVLKNDPATMDIPILILSIVQDRERGFRLGIDRYLTKPIDTEALFREVGSLLQQGKSHRKVMVVDEDASTVKTLAEVLQARGYHVVEANGPELVRKAVSEKPDIIILNSMLSGKQELVKTLRFEKGLEDVLFLVYQ